MLYHVQDVNMLEQKVSSVDLSDHGDMPADSVPRFMDDHLFFLLKRCSVSSGTKGKTCCMVRARQSRFDFHPEAIAEIGVKSWLSDVTEQVGSLGWRSLSKKIFGRQKECTWLS